MTQWIFHSLNIYRYLQISTYVYKLYSYLPTLTPTSTRYNCFATRPLKSSGLQRSTEIGIWYTLLDFKRIMVFSVYVQKSNWEIEMFVYTANTFVKDFWKSDQRNRDILPIAGWVGFEWNLKMLNSTFAGWMSMHQGFRICYVWNPRLNWKESTCPCWPYWLSY